MSDSVLQEMLPYLQGVHGNPHSSEHQFGWTCAQAVSTATQRIARLVGGEEDEIILTSGATEANNLALWGLAQAASGGDRNRILISAIEHKCVIGVCRAVAKQFGYIIETIPVDAQGFVNETAMMGMLDESVLAVSIMAVNNEIGTIQNMLALSQTIKSVGATFHSDAAQAPLAMDMGELAEHVDLISLSGHKMYGPQGIGSLFVRRGLQERLTPVLNGGGQQSGLRSGTIPVALSVGMGSAASMATSGHLEFDRDRLRRLRDLFIAGVLDIDSSICLNGPGSESRHPGNANMCFRGLQAQDLLNTLQPKLAASSGSACSSGWPEPSHVLRAIGLDGDEADASIRFSIGHGIREGDVQRAISIVHQAYHKCRR